MSTAVTTALIGAGVSVVISVWAAVWNHRSQQRIAVLEDTLAEARAARDAQRDYVYEARKRLYSEFQPLLFQLVESCESAKNRVLGLAQSASFGHLGPDAPGWLDVGYYLSSTIHRFLAPLVLVRLAQRRLTLVDLSVDPLVRFQYAMAKQLHATWNETWELAASEPAIGYDPHHHEGRVRADQQVYARQHVVAGYLDQAVDALIVRDNSAVRCMTYGEFEEAFESADSPLNERIQEFAALFVAFHPHTKPVLWRTLLAQAHIYEGLISSFESERSLVTPAEAFPGEDIRLFDWRTAGSEVTFDAAVTGPVTAVRGFLRERIAAPAAVLPGADDFGSGT